MNTIKLYLPLICLAPFVALCLFLLLRSMFLAFWPVVTSWNWRKLFSRAIYGYFFASVIYLIIVSIF